MWNSVPSQPISIPRVELQHLQAGELFMPSVLFSHWALFWPPPGTSPYLSPVLNPCFQYLMFYSCSVHYSLVLKEFPKEGLTRSVRRHTFGQCVGGPNKALKQVKRRGCLHQWWSSSMALWKFHSQTKKNLNSKRKNWVISWEPEFIPHSAAPSEA